MKFSHIKLAEIESTQYYLKDHLSKLNVFKNVLVTTEKQTAGVGRRGTEWIMLQNCLAFSFTYKPNFPTELTSLAIGMALASYFSKYNPKLRLKWPNDLYLEGKKVGGIICSLMDDIIIVGVGINFGESAIENYNFPYCASSLLSHRKLKAQEYHDIPADFLSHLLQLKLDDSSITRDWTLLCCHMNATVEMLEDNKTYKGKFVGITDSGLAILDIDGSKKEFLSGHLKLIGDSD